MDTKTVTMQTQISNITPEGVSPHAEEKKTSFSDPAFSKNKTLPIHRWVPWIAGFSSDFVNDVIMEYIPCHKGLVLDPFAGVGTTLLEARLHNHESIGFEINPYAAFACEIKLTSDQIPITELVNEINRFDEYYSNCLKSNYIPKNSAPEGFKTRSEFYSPKILNKVLIVLDFINSIENKLIKNLFRLAFASTMVAYSNYSYEPSLGRRSHAGKNAIDDCPVEQVIGKKLNEMVKDIIWLKKGLTNETPNSRIISDSFFEYKKYLLPSSIDLIITSPPYLNNYHYNRNTRPQLYWLGYVNHPHDLIKYEHQNLGTFWQTVRDKKKIKLNFELPDSNLEELLELLSTKNTDKGVYGGQGWANYATAYFNDCYRFSLAMKEVLKEGGTAVVVLGNSILQGIMLPTDQYLADIAKSVGLDVLGIDTPRSKRIGNSIIQSNVRANKAEDTHKLYESIVKLRKS
jgi:DNA modification methylase